MPWERCPSQASDHVGAKSPVRTHHLLVVCASLSQTGLLQTRHKASALLVLVSAIVPCGGTASQKVMCWSAPKADTLIAKAGEAAQAVVGFFAAQALLPPEVSQEKEMFAFSMHPAWAMLF